MCTINSSQTGLSTIPKVVSVALLVLTSAKSWAIDWTLEHYVDTLQESSRPLRNLPPRQQEYVRERYQQWRALPLQEQQKLGTQLERFKALPYSKQQRIKAWRQWVKRLPPTEQQRLHQSWGSWGDKQRREHLQYLQQQFGR